MTDKVAVRQAEASDLAFIFSSWLKSHRDAEANPQRLRWRYHDSTKFMLKESYFSSYKAHVTRLLENSQIVILCDPEDPRLLYSYVVFQHIGSVPIIHYGYTKHVYRKFGFFKRLATLVNPELGKQPLIVTVHNSMVRELSEKWKLIFDPYIMEAT